MLWIGLTGGYGSGKSTAAKLLKQRGFAVIDADVLARLALGPGTQGQKEVVNQFGASLLLPSGELDRKRLGEIVFRDPALLQALERIVHPEVRRKAESERQRLKEEGHEVAFYDVPLLFEKNMEPLFDKIIVVNSSLEDQILRAMQRDGVTREAAMMRIKNQISLSEKTKRANFVLENGGTLNDLEKQIDQLLKQLRIKS